jgi:iron(III) transport system ATP-binding protein
MSASLEVRELCKQFAPAGRAAAARPAIDGVSFTVPAGEIVVLLGPSGCGKTTTLRCVAGLEHPTSGTIGIGGRIVSAPAEGVLVPPRLREIGMVFQSYAVWPHMTVRQNVAYPLKQRRISRADADRMVQGALELVGLPDYAERPVVSLSGGQMQRVALARSMVYRPQLLLLDEPLSNLDAKLRVRLRDDLRHILKQTGMTALNVTHDQAEAVVLGDRIGVMRDGRILQMAPPGEIYNRPVDLFIANFTGASNLLTGTVAEQSGDRAMIAMPDGSRLATWTPERLQPGAAARIAIRPENVGVGLSGVHGEGHNVFTGRILDRRYQGVQTIYDVEVLGSRLESLELGTAARHEVGVTLPISLPQPGCWAYPDEGGATAD